MNKNDSPMSAAGHSAILEHDARGAGSALSWSAIIAGAAAAAALSLILLILGTALGLSSVSPWARVGISAASFGISTILWITITQILASGMGGYLAGRFRTRWVGVHVDEAHFRDTAHGFLAWSIATLATATLLVSAIGTSVSDSAKAGASIAGGVAAAAAVGGAAVASDAQSDGKSNEGSGVTRYLIDSLFRKESPGVNDARKPHNASSTASSDTSALPTGTNAEVTRIIANAIRTGGMPPDDVRYTGQLVAQRTGLSQQDAEMRVTDTFARTQKAIWDAESSAKDAADKGRKASAYAALWLFISLLVGAFVASLAAVIGGRQRECQHVSQY